MPQHNPNNSVNKGILHMTPKVL